MTLKQVQLKFGRESLTIPYPQGFRGRKSGSPQDDEFMLSMMPRTLTDDEIALAEKFISTLTYKQQLAYTDCVFLEPGDPLLTMTHEELDRLEEDNGLDNTSASPGGGQRSILERVLLIRHAGYEEQGRKAIAPGK